MMDSIRINVDEDAQCEVMVESTKFINNTNMFYDYYAVSMVSGSRVTILNSEFINGDRYGCSLKIENQFVDIIVSKWLDYNMLNDHALVSISN